MTITEVSLTKYDSKVTANGTTCDVELDVEFTGAFDAVAARSLDEVTPVGFDAPMSIVVGDEMGTGSGIRITDRSPKLGTIASDGSPGMFTIYVSATDAVTGDFAGDPLQRKDAIVVRRGIETVPISRDRTGRLIATYYLPDDIAVAFEDEKPDAKPLEIFANLPTVPAERFTATITGYRSEYKIAMETLDEADPDSPTEQPCIVVNDAPVTIGGISWPKGMVALGPCTAQPVVVAGFEVIAHTWEVWMNPRGWNQKVLNAGVYSYNADTGKRERMWDPATNTPRTTPYPLDENGAPLDDFFAVSDAVYLNFIVTREGDFGSFNWNF